MFHIYEAVGCSILVLYCHTLNIMQGYEPVPITNIEETLPFCERM